MGEPGFDSGSGPPGRTRTHDARTALTADLEAALLRELAYEYRHLALAYFKGSLRLPQFELVDSRLRLGRWVPELRIVELSRPLLVEQPWGVVVEVLKHEMAHQYVGEVLGEHSESARHCERCTLRYTRNATPEPEAPRPKL